MHSRPTRAVGPALYPQPAGTLLIPKPWISAVLPPATNLLEEAPPWVGHLHLLRRITASTMKTPDGPLLFGTSKGSKESIHHALFTLLALRNPYAHDTVMNRVDYDTKKGSILGPFDTPTRSVVDRIISLKTAIRDFATIAGENDVWCY